jgi:Flp pilus assembly protein TadD
VTFSDMDTPVSPIAATRLKRQLAEQATALAANGQWAEAAETNRRLLELGPEADA